MHSPASANALVLEYVPGGQGLSIPAIVPGELSNEVFEKRSGQCKARELWWYAYNYKRRILALLLWEKLTSGTVVAHRALHEFVCLVEATLKKTTAQQQ